VGNPTEAEIKCPLQNKGGLAKDGEVNPTIL